jgi:uncharacterized protein HemX
MIDVFNDPTVKSALLVLLVALLGFGVKLISHWSEKLAQVSSQLSAIATVTDQTHAASNGAKSAMERVEQDLRAELKAAVLALYNEREKVAVLTQQLAQALLLSDPSGGGHGHQLA